MRHATDAAGSDAASDLSRCDFRGELYGVGAWRRRLAWKETTMTS